MGYKMGIGTHKIKGEDHYQCREVKIERDILLNACQLAYRKHHRGDDMVGWEELSNILYDALCSTMGDDEFVVWNEKLSTT